MTIRKQDLRVGGLVHWSPDSPVAHIPCACRVAELSETHISLETLDDFKTVGPLQLGVEIQYKELDSITLEQLEMIFERDKRALEKAEKKKVEEVLAVHDRLVSFKQGVADFWERYTRFRMTV